MKEKSKQATELEARLVLIAQEQKIINDSCERSLSSFNQLLTEVTNVKLFKTHLVAMQNIKLDAFEIIFYLVYASPNGPVTNQVGSASILYTEANNFSTPPANEICQMVDDFLTRTTQDTKSPLMIAIAGVRELESFVVRQNLLRK